MGCDIHAVLQIKLKDNWITERDIFDWRNYGAFGLLANVRNYSCIEPISEPRGYPEDFLHGYDTDDRHSSSWLSAEELINYDWDKTFENRQYAKYYKQEKVSEFLGPSFMADIRLIKIYSEKYGLENIRVVFDFDS